jgi:hypothetical protein
MEGGEWIAAFIFGGGLYVLIITAKMTFFEQWNIFCSALLRN